MGEPWTLIPQDPTHVYLEDGLKITLPTNYTLHCVTNMSWSKVMYKTIYKNFWKKSHYYKFYQ
jgi:hypothetical protein